MSRRKRRPKASPARDKHRLYQAAVQGPEGDIELFEGIYRGHRDRPPLALREDFCGTALFSVQWALTRPDRTALAIDLDAETLEWGRRNNLAAAGEAAARVTLVRADVRQVRRARGGSRR